MTDRATVVRLAVARSQRGFSTVDGVNALVAPGAGGGVGAIIDKTHLPSVGAAPDLYNEHWFNRPNAANAEDVRRLLGDTDYAPSTGLLTHNGPDWTIAPLASGDDGVYLLTLDDINDWNYALNIALTEKVFRLVYKTWTPTTSGNRQYDPTAAPISATWLTDRAQIRGVEHHDAGEAASQLIWKKWSRNGRAVKWYEDSDAIVLDFFGGTAPTTSDRLRLINTRTYDAVTAEGTTIPADETWLVWATIKAMADMHRDPDNPEDRWNEMLRKKRVGQHLRSFRRRHLGRYWGTTSDTEAFQAGGPAVTARSR